MRANVTELGIRATRVDVSDGRGRSERLELELTTAAGELVPRSTRPGELERTVLGTPALQLLVGQSADGAGTDDAFVPVEPGIVLQRLASGGGALTLTDQRALGVVWDSAVSAPDLAAALDSGGSGSVLAFSVDRELLPELDLDKDESGALRYATLSGACFVMIHPRTALDAVGAFVTPAKGLVAAELTVFANQW